MSTQFTQTKRASDHTLKLVQTIGPEGSPNQSVFTNYADNADRLRAIEYHNMEWHSPPNSHNETSVFYLSKESSGEQQLTFAEYMAWVGAGNGEDGTFTRDDCRYCQTARSQGPNPRRPLIQTVSFPQDFHHCASRWPSLKYSQPLPLLRLCQSLMPEYFNLSGSGDSHRYKVVQKFGPFNEPTEVYTNTASTVAEVQQMAGHVMNWHATSDGSSTCSHFVIGKDGDRKVDVLDASEDANRAVSSFKMKDCHLCVSARESRK